MQVYGTFGLPTLNGEGAQAFGFGGNGAVSGTLSQTFDTVSGQTYSVGFQYVIQQGSEFEDLTLDVLDGSTALATQALHFNNTNWLTSALNFTAISGATTLRFSDTKGAVDPGTGFSTNWALATAAMPAVWALAAAFRFRRC